MNRDSHSTLGIIPHLTLPLNSKGKDFIVGDIHGEYQLLKKAMKKINFKYEADRLICTGDLIDRGSDSSLVLDLLTEDFFFSTLGNHEEMLLKYSASKTKREYYWYPNGGKWWSTVDVQSQRYYENLIRNKMPILITIQLNSYQIGVVHADFPLNTSWISAIDEIENENISLAAFVWRRDRIENKITNEIQKIKHVFIGHTPLEEVVTLGNCTFIDTGCGHSASNYIKNPSLTICEIDGNEFTFHRFKK